MFQTKIKNNLQFPGHQDMHLMVPDIDLNVVADSYYLTLDPRFMPEEETFEKALIIFNSLLSQWVLAVQRMYEQQIAYLPFDFADQGVGGFEVIKNEDVLFMRYFIQDKQFGASYEAGNKLILYPSMSYNEMIYNNTVTNLRYINKAICISIQQFAKEITAERKNIPFIPFSH